MAFNIARAQYFHPGNNQIFFLDANIWINVLAGPNKPNFAVQQYQRIFSEIVTAPNCKILMPSLLVSEIVNRVMKGVNFIKFANCKGVGLGGNSIPSSYYKEIYRPSPEYFASYKILFDDFASYGNAIRLIEDGFGANLQVSDIFDEPSQKMDFNDSIYVLIAQNTGATFVTDDRDFWIEDIPIVTQNSTILQKYNQIIVPPM